MPDFVANFYKFRIKKKSGGYRTIYAPDKATKERLRPLAERLGMMTALLCDPTVVHGFVPGRNPVTNAMRHVGRQYTVCMDIADFFDHVTEKLLGVHKTLIPVKLCMPEGFAAQGLPTSPPLSNLAMIQFDQAVSFTLQTNGWLLPARDFVYTRYADDIAISFDMAEGWSLGEVRKRVVEPLVEEIGSLLADMGMAINEKKVRLLHATSGRRRIITGVSVGENDVRIPRATRRRLRAATHKCPGSLQTRGLAEWGKLKLPKDWQSQVRDRISVLQQLQRDLKKKTKELDGLTVRVFSS